MERYACVWSLVFFVFKQKLLDETEHIDHARGHDSFSYP